MESSGPETTPVSPVLAGRFLSTMPPGKFNRFLRYLYKYFLSYTSKLLLHHVATVTFGKMKTISILLQLDLTFWAWACLTLDLWCLWSYSWYPCMRRAGRSSSYRVNLESVQDWTQWVNACSSAPSSWQFRGASTWSSESDSKTKLPPPTAMTCPKMHPYFVSPFSRISFFPVFTHDSLR